MAEAGEEGRPVQFWADTLKAVLPIITFGAGFVLNAWWERRKRRTSRAEAAVRELVAGLHEWHQAWQKMMMACRDASTIGELNAAIDNFRSQSTIAARIDFNIAVLRQNKRTARFADVIDNSLGRSKPHNTSEGDSSLFQAIDAGMRHRLVGAAAHLAITLHVLELDEANPEEVTERIRDARQGIGAVYDNFESVFVSLQQSAANILSVI